MSSKNFKIPVKDGLWEEGLTKNAKPCLIGSECTSCGELYFPKKDKKHCIRCQAKCLIDKRLSTRGKIASFTVVERAPAGGFYKGPIPYAYGYVHLTDNVRIKSIFAGKLYELKIGMDVELSIEGLFNDKEGNEIVTYKFRAING